jgi:hypothetical protein
MRILAREVSAPRTQVQGDLLIGLSLASEGIFCLAVRHVLIGEHQERVEGGADQTQEQQPSHGQASAKGPVLILD